jgi:hypothetical protein
LSKINVW